MSFYLCFLITFSPLAPSPSPYKPCKERNDMKKTTHTYSPHPVPHHHPLGHAPLQHESASRHLPHHTRPRLDPNLLSGNSHLDLCNGNHKSRRSTYSHPDLDTAAKPTPPQLGARPPQRTLAPTRHCRRQPAVYFPAMPPASCGVGRARVEAARRELSGFVGGCVGEYYDGGDECRNGRGAVCCAGTAHG